MQYFVYLFLIDKSNFRNIYICVYLYDAIENCELIIIVQELYYFMKVCETLNFVTLNIRKSKTDMANKQTTYIYTYIHFGWSNICHIYTYNGGSKGKQRES